MFIPRSAARVRLVRVVFLLVAAAPAAGLAAWAVHLRSAAHRSAVERGWQQALGLPVTVEAVEHPRPGVVRARGCVVGSADGGTRLSVPWLEVETAADEVRVRIEQAGCDAAVAGLLTTLAAEWLARGPRYERNCLVEVADFAWLPPAEAPAPSPAGSPAGLRVECVARAEARAIRVVRPGREGLPASELRVVRTAVAAANDAGGVRVDVVGEVHEPLPCGVLAALVGVAEWSFGDTAVAQGRLEVSHDGRGWNGEAEGRIQRIDLAACGAALDMAAAGEVMLDVRRLRLADGRLLETEVECHVGRGFVTRRFLDALVTVVGCRPGPALGAPPDGRLDLAPFDAAGALVRVSDGGVELLAGTGLAGALAVTSGQPLVWPPTGPVAAERLAWLVAPPASPAVPAAGPGAWLLSILPRPGQRLETGRAAVPPDRPREF